MPATLAFPARAFLAGVLTLACSALAQPGKTIPENPRQPDAAAPAAPAPAPKATQPQKEELVYMTMQTSKGDIVLELNKSKAPITVENFVKYAAAGQYDGTIFHRVIPTFMIQGGGFDKDMREKPTGAAIKNEWQNGLKNARGTIAMARVTEPDSATAQFFINVVDNDRLSQAHPRTGNAGYAVFGKVISGMDVVDQIKNVPTVRPPGSGPGDPPSLPTEAVVITKVRTATTEEVAKAGGVR